MVDLSCQAEIEADPDIGGRGVMTSFLVVAWVTIALAALSAYDDLIEWWPRLLQALRSWPEEVKPPENTATTETRAGKTRRSQVKKVKKLLVSICDLQIITGIAIVIAGFSQIQTITYYHEQLVIGYWWMTLNSFWAARVEYMDEGVKDDWLRLTARRVTMLISCVLGVTFQGYINVREQEWDNVDGPCYRWGDTTSSWPWVAGTSTYCIALIILIIPKTEPALGAYFRKTEEWQKAATSWFRRSCQRVVTRDMDLTDRHSATKRALTNTYNFFLMILSGAWLLLYWLSVQFMAVMSFQQGFYPLFVFFYAGFNVWNTYDVLSLKVLNQALIHGDENKMGFGQVLPLILIGAIGFNAVDTFRNKELAEVQKETVATGNDIEMDDHN